MPSFLNKVANPCLNTSSPDFLACCAMSRMNLDSVTTGVIHLHPPAEDCWDCGCPQMRRDKRGADSSLLPLEGTSPLTPWPWASGLQKSERIHFCGIKLPTFWHFVTAATETNKTPYLDGILFLFKKIFYFIQVQLIDNVLLISAVQHSDPVYIYMDIVFHTLFHHDLSRDIKYSFLLFVHPIYNSLHLLILNSQSIPPPPPSS